MLHDGDGRHSAEEGYPHRPGVAGRAGARPDGEIDAGVGASIRLTTGATPRAALRRRTGR